MVSKIPSLFGWLKPGDVVAFNHPDHGIMIKIIDRLDQRRREYFVIGLDERSVDSRRFGPVPGSAVVGKVIWHIKKPMA